MTNSEPLALSLDIGTSSSRALLWDSAGREVMGTGAQVHYQMRTTPDGGVEMDAEDLLMHISGCIDRALSAAGDRAKHIKAVGISTFWHSLLGIDAAGNAVTPIFSWADNRAAEQAEILRAKLDAAQVHRQTGCIIHPSYYPARLLWLKNRMGASFDLVHRWVSPSEYLFGKWFGRQAVTVSVSMASGTGLFLQSEQTWDADLAETIGIGIETLSRIVDLKEFSSGLSQEYSKRWSALREVPFYPAVGDGACGNIGSGCTAPDRLAINLGTSGAIRAVWSEDAGNSEYQHPGHGLWRYRVDSRRPVIGAAFSDGGHVFAWMTRCLNLSGSSPEQLDTALSAMQPGAHGLTFLPFLAGERSMGWHVDARAGIFGLNLDTGPLDILRASMEAVALQFMEAALQLQQTFPAATEIVASGGALGHSRAWQQMFADAIGCPVTLAEEPEASSRGAALLALEAAGIISSIAEAPARLGKTIEPNLKVTGQYMDMSSRRNVIYRALFPDA